MDMELFARALGAIFAIMNPFVVLPIFLSVTAGIGGGTLRRVALATTLYVAAICAVVGVAGDAILRFFSITVDDFRVAGGLVLLLIGLGMLKGQENTAHQGTPAEQMSVQEAENVAFYPLAFPMIVGPGTITTLLIFTAEAREAEDFAAVGLATALVILSLGVVLWFASAFGHYMSQTLRIVTTRIMGMLLAAIAAGILAAGLKALLPGLA